jgi:hypothetical protein
MADERGTEGFDRRRCAAGSGQRTGSDAIPSIVAHRLCWGRSARLDHRQFAALVLLFLSNVERNQVIGGYRAAATRLGKLGVVAASARLASQPAEGARPARRQGALVVPWKGPNGSERSPRDRPGW